MRGFLFIAVVLIILINLNCSTPTRRSGDIPQDVKNFFGDRITGIIEGAESASSFRLKPEKTKDVKIENIHKFPVVSRGPVLTENQIVTLKNILLDEKTYNFKYAKRAFVFPEYAIVLKKGNDSVTVLVDFYRKEFLFVDGDRELVEDFDSAENQLKALIDEIFK